MLAATVGLMNGFIFGFSFLAKLADVRELRIRMGNIIPDRLARWAGIVLLLSEGAVAVMSIAVPRAQAALVAAAALYAGFAVAGRLQLSRGGSDVSCGCLGRVANLDLTWVSLSINVVLALICVAVALPHAGSAGIRSGLGDQTVLLEMSFLLASSYWLLIYAASALKKVDRSLAGGS